MSKDTIYRQDTIDAMCKLMNSWFGNSKDEREEITWIINHLSSAQSEIAEKLSMYKCYITDENGLQHEVIHTGDIRRVTGWMI